MFDHEPFHTFQSKVVLLCKEKWPTLSSNAFEVSRIEGGSYNRVVDVKVDTFKVKQHWYKRHTKRALQRICLPSYRNAISGNQIHEYIIRMPRFEHAWFEQEVALLLYLEATQVPVPLIKSFDVSSTNVLETRHTLQTRIPGKSVQECYSDLNTTQRMSFARDLGLALKEMRKQSFPYPGTLDPVIILSDSVAQILHVQCPPRNARRPPSG